MSTEGKVTAKGASPQRRSTKDTWLRRWPWLILVVAIIVGASLLGWKLTSDSPKPTEPPEAQKVLSAQESMKQFGILIPAYLPKGFNRANVEIKVQQSDPVTEPTVDMIYRKGTKAAIYMKQWLPVNPELQVLYGSRPIQTKWGKGWLLTQGTNLISLWVDVGPLRISLSTPDLDVVSREQLLLAADTLGLASNLQVYSFVTKLPVIQDVTPPPPFEVKVNANGVQELNLTITPGGYSPMRFAVQRGLPVKLNFRALGEVGCGNMLIFPTGPDKYASLLLSDDHPTQVLEFTPELSGDFEFQCTNKCFRGIMTVR